MDKVEALERINETWNSKSRSLGEKIIRISSDFYAVGLDISTTAAYIKATPSELDALLSLSALDDDIIDAISILNPPKTIWALMANASEEETRQALISLEKGRKDGISLRTGTPLSEYIYQQMLEVSGPTTEQLVGMLTGKDLNHAKKKGEDFSAFTDWELKFLKSIVAQKKKGKTLSNKQIAQVIKILETLADKKVIERNSIDGDREICDRILDAIGR